MPKPQLFLDTAYIYALFNTRDQWHATAIEWQERLQTDNCLLVTTQLILVEIGNGLSGQRFRKEAGSIIRSLQESPLVNVIPVDPVTFAQAFDLFELRQDKDWGLTDCYSFVVMQDLGLTDSLTTDDHFHQAGFNALLLA